MIINDFIPTNIPLLEQILHLHLKILLCATLPIDLYMETILEHLYLNWGTIGIIPFHFNFSIETGT